MSNNYGLTALMESISHSETAAIQNDQLYMLVESSVPDDVAAAVTGDDYDLTDEDSVERDLAGRGIGYDEELKLKKLIDTIPEDDGDTEIDETEISELTESLIGDL